MTVSCIAHRPYVAYETERLVRKGDLWDNLVTTIGTLHALTLVRLCWTMARQSHFQTPRVRACVRAVPCRTMPHRVV
eukprot:3396920-Pleurochrysis_carterae.AAC.2